MYVATSELFVMTIISFCAAARDGVKFTGTPDRQKIYYDAILVPLLVDFHERVGLPMLLNILEKTNFDSTLALLSFDRTNEVDWASVIDPDPWLSYEWDRGSVFPLSEAM